MEIKSVTTGGGPVKESEIIKQNLNLKQQQQQPQPETDEVEIENQQQQITNYNDINGEGDIINNINSDKELILIDQKINVNNDIIQSSINIENISLSPSHIEPSNNFIINNNNNYNNNNSNNMCNTEINKLSSPTSIKIRQIEIKEPCTNGESEIFDKNVHQEDTVYLSPVGGTSKSTNFLSLHIVQVPHTH